MTEPNLFVVGAQRAGSTSMWRYLRAHPEIFLAEAKEPGFLCFAGGRDVFAHVGDDTFYDQIVTDEAAYEALFRDGADSPYRGESSSFYLYFPEAIAELDRRYPESRLVVILRDPVDRAWSSFQYLRRLGGEPLESFADALAAEPRRIADNWEPLFHYVAASRYAEQLRRLYDQVDRSRVFVLYLEALQADGPAELGRLFRWLGVDPDVDVGADVQHNSAARSKFPLLDKVLSPGFLPSGLADRIPRDVKDRAVRLREKARSGGYDGLDPALREELLARLADDLGMLGDVVDDVPTAWWPSLR